MLFNQLETQLKKLPETPLSEERKALWQDLAQKIKSNPNGALCFVCTHNSRRSALSQALAAAFNHQTQKNIHAIYSGGAEVTRIHPNTLATLRDLGFQIDLEDDSSANKRYLLRYAEEAAGIPLFSKTFDDAENALPYHAVMVCAAGDAACPFIPMALSRTLIPFEDPGAWDDTEQAPEAYLKTATQIANEIQYLMSIL